MTRRDPPDLAALDEAFAAAAPATVPDGHYTVVVVTVTLRRVHRTGAPMLCWALRVESPAFAAGRHLWRHLVLSPATLGWLKHDLRLCGLELPRLSALPDCLDRLRGVRLEVAKRTRGDNYALVVFRHRTA
jgi:hypothetical protein